ncbi:GGDEF domain-containing response regulator [Neorhizobium huautlense]|nr:PleD family two-component system response regulator [Neorhizobium huautlense]
MAARKDARRASAVTEKDGYNRILLIEDSPAMTMLLRQRMEEETGAEVVCCNSQASARVCLENEHFTLALTGLNLPDSPRGEILGLLSDFSVPTIVFTAIFDPESRERYAQKKIIDYIVKDGPRTIETVIETVARILSNSAFTILVVDDARSARSGLVEILARQNFRVLEAHSGKQALEILEAEEKIDLVVTDYHMPDMDGYELTRRIRETRSSEEMRIVGVSSSTDRWLSASFLKAGACDFIYRPFVPEELQCRIDNNIETLKQIQRLRYLADRDYLTGLSNRRCFFEKTRQMEDARLSDHCSSVAILDIDHFKKINDTYGHEAGDRVLKMVADTLAETCAPAKHFAARLGGEEFALYLRNTDAFQAHSFCERIRQQIEELVMEVNKHEIAVTISIGVVETETGESFDNNLNAADQLLYLAKSNGRNRVYSTLTLPEAMVAANASAVAELF